MCGILGRPTVIDDREMSMKIPDTPMLEQTRLTAAFMNLCSDLVSMSYRIRQRAYFDKTSAEERSPTLAVAMALLRECDNFFAKIPPHMSVEHSPGHPDLKAMILLLHVYYYYTRCVISRDFLIQKVESNVCFLENKTPPASEDWSTTLVVAEDCVESVHKSLRCITIGIDLGIFEIIGYSWLDFFFVFHAVLIVCADFLARPKGQTDSPKDIERKATVRTVLDQVRGMQKLAPTYNTLGQIALQFAIITGVTQDNDSSAIPDVPHEASLDPGVDMVADERTEHANILDIADDWYTDATVDLGLDFFDLGQATHPVAFPNLDAPSRPENVADPTVDTVDDWTDRALKGMHTL
jgi:separase